MAVGDTTVDPLAATPVPFSVTVVAFVVDQVTVLDCPAWIDVGEAETAAVGTDIVVVDVEVDVLPDEEVDDEEVVEDGALVDDEPDDGELVEVDADFTVTVAETIVVPVAFVAVRK